MNKEELDEILDKHSKWLRNEKDGERANLSYADLRNADLINADLINAYLKNAYLRNADLRNADLRNADLRNADLRNANLRNANLRGANLRGANLSDADLRGANLRGVNLSDAKNLYLPQACPEKGSFIGFKKALTVDAQVIIELLIPEDAHRSSSTSRKCRCSKAKVVSITTLDGKGASVLTVAYSSYDNTFLYKVGETVEVDNFDPDRWNECAPGIHFFITREEAVRY